MPRLDPEFLESAEQAKRPHRARPVTAERRADRSRTNPPAAEPAPGEERPAGRESLLAVLWPALATFALVFGLGVFVFWLLHPGRQPAVTPPARGVVLPSFALVIAWVAALLLLPRFLPRALAWSLLIAGTVFVAIVMSREITAWLQAVIGSIQL
jgi:hypothetical protein